MPAYHQMGHGSVNLVTDPHLGGFGGCILSPVNYTPEEVAGQVVSWGSIPDFDIVFDPQLYYPKSNRGQLHKWPHFPSNVDSADLSSTAWWNSIIENMLAVCSMIKPAAACSPALVPKSFGDQYYNHLVQVGSRTARRLEGISIRPIQTAIVGMADVSQSNRPQIIASILSRTPASEIYLVLINDIEPRREVSDPEELKGAMRLISELAAANLAVLVGFCSSDVVLWKHAGAMSCASGKFFNLRRFTSSRFQEPSAGGGQLPYWFEESLMAYLRESDIVRIRQFGLNCPSSDSNPFCQDITHKLESDPGSAWISLGWRQFLYWFRDVQDRFDSGTVDIRALLKTAEDNWLSLEDKEVFMEEARNGGQWIRSWRRAVAEYAV